MKIMMEDDIGFVEMVTCTPLDPFIHTVNAARVSFRKEIQEMGYKDHNLLSYLTEKHHTSPFRHWTATFRIKAPRAIAMQMYKHAIGCVYTFKDTGWNEMSQRYVKVPNEALGISAFREQSTYNKQSSAGEVKDQLTAQATYELAIHQAQTAYEYLLEQGVCREQARMVLPLATYTEWYWTPTLQALNHFVKLRTHAGAQQEIQCYAKAVQQLFDLKLITALEEE